MLRGISLAQLCARSEIVARGEVVKKRAQWRGGRIVTAVTLRVERSLIGNARRGDQITFWRLGGEVGGIGQLVVGAPRFRIGEQVVVFLHRRQGHLFVTSMVQGTFRVIAASRGGPWVVPAAARVKLQGTGRPLSRPLPLADFEQHIRGILRTQSQRRP